MKADIAAPPFLPWQMRGGTQVGPGISCWILDGWNGDMSLLERVSGVGVNKDRGGFLLETFAKVHDVNIPIVASA